MLLLLFGAGLAMSCPFAGKITPGQDTRIAGRVAPDGYLEAFAKIDWDMLKEDLIEVMTTSQDSFPADYGNYGPLWIRLAWHNAGSYRTSDGRGGADGGRQRFDPERSWDDNTNLDKARKMLEPIKQKYGVGLSWGDLIVFAGNVAIESLEGIDVPFCGGRIDDPDGSWSERLGPTFDQETNEPCELNGDCRTPFGANQIGLIYVNPEGFLGNPDPVMSADAVRSTFGRMGMNDSETVALVAGGHSFGKVHGACTTGPGPNPMEAPLAPWPGTCGTPRTPGFGVGVNTFTSGFEGPWTSTPLEFDTEYLDNLLNFDWEVHIGPGGHYQWRVVGSDTKRVGPYTTFADGTGMQNVMMLTADVAFIYDDDYTSILKEYAGDFNRFETSWIATWYKLMSRDMGPVSRCLGPKVPAARPFQGPLPDPPANLADMNKVRLAIRTALSTRQSIFDSQPRVTTNMQISDLVRLAFRCAATFRVTDYNGGCNGARIRGPIQQSWEVNQGLDRVLATLEPVKKQFGEGLSWADLIVLAGTVALEVAGAPKMEFCPGRVDVDITAEDQISANLAFMNTEPVIKGEFEGTIDDLEQWTLLLGMSKPEMTALLGAAALGNVPQRLAATTAVHQRTSNPEALSSEYYSNLLNLNYVTDERLYFAQQPDQFGFFGRVVTATRTDILLVSSAEFRDVVVEYAGNESKFLSNLADAWTKLMNADRFDGPLGNVCDSPTAMPTGRKPPSGSTPRSGSGGPKKGREIPKRARSWGDWVGGRW